MITKMPMRKLLVVIKSHHLRRNLCWSLWYPMKCYFSPMLMAASSRSWLLNRSARARCGNGFPADAHSEIMDKKIVCRLVKLCEDNDDNWTYFSTTVLCRSVVTVTVVSSAPKASWIVVIYTWIIILTNGCSQTTNLQSTVSKFFRR